jgi:hypothetical protein
VGQQDKKSVIQVVQDEIYVRLAETACLSFFSIYARIKIVNVKKGVLTKCGDLNLEKSLVKMLLVADKPNERYLRFEGR